jgi:hypothetical protein
MIQTVTFDPTIYQGMIDQFSKDITRIPVTKTTDGFTGDETLTDGTSVTITGTIFLKKNTFLQTKEGLVQGGDAMFIGYPNITLNKNDKLVYQGTTYRIDNTTIRYLDRTPIYLQADLFIVTVV